MNLPQEETRGKKIVLAVLIFLLGLLLVIIGANFFFQKNKNQVAPVQKPANIINPAPSNVQAPSSSSSSVQVPSNIPSPLPNTPPSSEKEKTTAPPSVQKSSNSPDFTTPSNNEKIPPPLP